MSVTSKLLLPPRSLADCVYCAMVRDTRGCELSDETQFNYFPASPLIVVTLVFDGQIHMATADENPNDVRNSAPMASCFVTQPLGRAIVSWSPGPVAAISLCFYPDAWRVLSAMADPIAIMQSSFIRVPQSEDDWTLFCDNLAPTWLNVRPKLAFPQHAIGRLRSWAGALLARAGKVGLDASVRTIERRIRRWAGVNRSQLEYYGRLEELHRAHSTLKKATNAAQLAFDAGYADQSHMGRAVLRSTGFTPARLARLIACNEKFWFYRALARMHRGNYVHYD